MQIPKIAGFFYKQLWPFAVLGIPVTYHLLLLKLKWITPDKFKEWVLTSFAICFLSEKVFLPLLVFLDQNGL